MRAALHFAGQVLSWVVILGIGAVLTVSVLIPRIGGATPYVILTGSMRPAMPPGTLVVSKPVPAERIGIGTVVTYQLKSGDPTVVTHRVVSVGVNGRGEYVFTTKGDANNAPDVAPVRAVQVRGERWYYVPYLGYLTTVVTGKERHLAMIVVVSFLLCYAAAMFTSSLRDRFRRRPRHREATS